MKDWNGNQNSIYKTLGASNHTNENREENDYYATEPKSIDLLVEVEEFDGDIWEPACGQGHMSERLLDLGFAVMSSDLINRGYGEQLDFLKYNGKFKGNIITNPPYKFAQEFIEKALDVIEDGFKVAMFLKVLFVEGKKRKLLFTKYPPKTIYVSSSRLLCAKNGDFENEDNRAVAYAWFVWQKGYFGDTVVKWIN